MRPGSEERAILLKGYSLDGFVQKPSRVNRPLPDTNTFLTASDLTRNDELGLSEFMHLLAFICWVCCLRARQFDKATVVPTTQITEAGSFKRTVEIFDVTRSAAIDRVS